MNIRQIIERHCKGESFEEIGSSLTPPVSKSTVCRWVNRYATDDDWRRLLCNAFHKKTKSSENVLTLS